MAIEAVVSVTILHKVTDILTQESIIFDKIIDQLEKIRLELRQMQGFLTDAEERPKDDKEAKKWVGGYLDTLYKVEDMVESHVLIESKKMKICLFQSYGFYFHDLTARQKLRRKMKQIEEKIKMLNANRPDNIKDASLRGNSIGKKQKQLVLDSNTPMQNSDFLGDKSMDLWFLGYADLPAHCKLCLLYLTLFPKEFDISVRRILRLWQAEGFLQRTLGSREDLAEKCFDNLVRRNLVKISKFRSDGGPKKCRLPGFLRECLSSKAQEISLFHIHHTSTDQKQQQSPSKNSTDTSEEQNIFPKPGVRRIVEYADIKDYDSDNNYQNLRSYLSFNFQRHDTPAKGVGNFLRRIIGNEGFGLLRVLDLEGVYKPILPTTLKHLYLLRYLGLRWTFLDSLPQSVGDLPYLETLDLKRTYINTLPSSVWKLKHLRHLNLPQVRLNMRMQPPSSKLLTLWGLIIDDGCHMDGLKKLHDLRELGITCQLKESNNLLKWINTLTHLQSLSLTSKDEKGRPSSLDLEPFSDLHKLSHLKLLGELSHASYTFPPNLRVLTLSLSNLKEDPMEILSQLRSLSVLRLLAKSYLGQKMHCQKDGFHNLHVLKLWMLDELEEWVVEQGGIPNIRELNIRSCQKLKELPKLLLKRTTLKELILTNMPEEFEEKVCISEHTNLQRNSYKVTLLPWEKDRELWK